MPNLHKVSFILLVLGGLGWLLEAFGVSADSFMPANIAQIVYVLVGLAAVNEIVAHKALCKQCVKGGV